MTMTNRARHARLRPLGPALLLSAAVLLSTTGAFAQKVHNTYGSPLDTLMNTHLTTTVPEAKGFVKATRPDKDALAYTPLTGTDPQRPKPRDAKGVEALQAELESAGARNEARAKGLLPHKAAAAHKGRASVSASASAGQTAR